MWERKTTPYRNADQPHQHFQELRFNRFSLTSSTGRWSSGQFCVFPCDCAIGFERHIFFYVTSKLRHVSGGSHHFEDIYLIWRSIISKTEFYFRWLFNIKLRHWAYEIAYYSDVGVPSDVHVPHTVAKRVSNHPRRQKTLISRRWQAVSVSET